VSTLYIRLPPRAVADSASRLLALACPFALISDGGAIEREGIAPLSALSETIARIQRVALLLDGSNVTVLRVQVPPLSAGRLKAALPNLVEEQLLCDPAECVIVAGGLSDGLRTIAVMQRAWLDLLAKTFIAFGARHIAALPAQLCLSYQTGQSGCVTAAINEWGANIDMTLRLSEQGGIGLLIEPALSIVEGGEGVAQNESNESAASVAIRTLCAVVPEASITLYVPQSAVHAYQEAAAPNKRINIFVDNWSHWIAGARVTTLDLMAGLSTGIGSKLDWHPWRWPLTLAVAVLVINAAVLNIDWWRMKGETKVLRTVMIQIYKSAYPKESVIIDPLAQMQQKSVTARRDSGLPAPDDFTSVTAAFGEAWISIAPTAGRTSTIASLEYREHNLFVHLKSGGEAPTQKMKAALAKRDLMLELAPEQAGAVVWQIRSAK
jgi:general secretion pathway protein L